jgi:hypothetical protein
MSINAEFVKMIVDRNPNREFYIEESFPLDLMYPYLEPHGLILKINHAALPSLSADTIQHDQDYWQARVQEMTGGWLRPETPLQTVLDFVDKTYGRKDLSDFTGNPHFVQDENSQKMFSKLRCAIAGLYAWRAGPLPKITSITIDPSNPQLGVTFQRAVTQGKLEYLPGSEGKRMIDAADLGFRQAFTLCPSSPEVVCRYSDFLVAQGRKKDAMAVLETGLRLTKTNDDKAATDIAQKLDELKALKTL